jgi:hypothetical protein
MANEHPEVRNVMWPAAGEASRTDGARARSRTAIAANCRRRATGHQLPASRPPARQPFPPAPTPSAPPGLAAQSQPAKPRSSAWPRAASACASPLDSAGRSVLLIPRSRLAGPGRDRSGPFGHKEGAPSGALGGRRATARTGTSPWDHSASCMSGSARPLIPRGRGRGGCRCWTAWTWCCAGSPMMCAASSRTRPCCSLMSPAARWPRARSVTGCGT